MPILFVRGEEEVDARQRYECVFLLTGGLLIASCITCFIFASGDIQAFDNEQSEIANEGQSLITEENINWNIIVLIGIYVDCKPDKSFCSRNINVSIYIFYDV